MDKKLHILFLSGWYPSRVSPSNGDFVQRHAEAVSTNYKVTLIHVVTDKNIVHVESTFKVINNVKTKIIYVPKTKNPLFKFYLFFKTYLNAINSIEDFQLIHLNIAFPKGIIALYLKWFKKKPYIISEHWSGYQDPQNKSIVFLQKMLTKKIVKNASFVCPVSKHLQKEMINFGLKGNYYPIPNVVDTSKFNVSEAISENFIISHVSGMNNEIKNIDGILNVISKLKGKIPNLEFNLIGNNSNNYLLKIKQLNIKNINIIDQISNMEVANYLKNSNLFILFSNYENLPCVILEAFACGVPVVSTNVGGISEYFPENFGYLITIKDEIELEKAILKIYNNKLNFNKKLMHNYAENNFGVKTIANSFSKIYYKTLNDF